MANGNACYVLGMNKFSGIFQARKMLKMTEKSEKCFKKRKNDSKYKSGWSKVIAKKVLDGHLRFGKLATLINILLILLYDQALVERLFSMVGKIDTQYRYSLSTFASFHLLELT